jgi:hypothetical protein
MGLRISRSEQENCLGVSSSCPTGWLSESWEIGILRSSQVSEMSTCCPTESKQIPEVNFSPERGSQQREEPGERMAPAANDAEKPHQDVEQQRRPELPAGRISRRMSHLAGNRHYDLPGKRRTTRACPANGGT